MGGGAALRAEEGGGEGKISDFRFGISERRKRGESKVQSPDSGVQGAGGGNWEEGRGEGKISDFRFEISEGRKREIPNSTVQIPDSRVQGSGGGKRGGEDLRFQI
ncbi:MAG: hypothetical protein JSR77_13040 [Planctomycetes bacterium]|nr:hypothetical protein [Planctomycetota bacterium]